MSCERNTARELAHLNALRARLAWLCVDAAVVEGLAELRIEAPGGSVWVSATQRGSYVLHDGLYQRSVASDPWAAARGVVRYLQGRLPRRG
ncbi:hypothetical protein HDA32_001453 [Spinactinospora alkalitolerans]|uniref:Uncharacterized protein n=1 Tax=Spinactinospora alkalitolerans TaxID=687207 RepID=A0A852TU91_9ACTN|nr:hypothetical protein [Spinactinospora alkalitolerans]NYE46333.1 hypothetical protein [Spinactinospora alkalitolerans]